MADGSDCPGGGTHPFRWRLYAQFNHETVPLFVTTSGPRATEAMIVNRCAATARRHLQGLGWSSEHADLAKIRAVRI